MQLLKMNETKAKNEIKVNLDLQLQFRIKIQSPEESLKDWKRATVELFCSAKISLDSVT